MMFRFKALSGVITFKNTFIKWNGPSKIRQMKKKIKSNSKRYMIMLWMFKSDHKLFAKVYVLKYFQIENQNNYLFLNKKKNEESCKYIWSCNNVHKQGKYL